MMRYIHDRFRSDTGWNSRVARTTVFAAASLAALIIGYASLVPGSALPPEHHMDKIVHFIAYMGLAFLFCVSTLAPWRISAFLLVVAYSGAIELLQHAMNLGRTGSWLDMLANVLGAVMGMIIALCLSKLWAMRRAATAPAT